MARTRDARLVRHLSIEELQSILDTPPPLNIDGNPRSRDAAPLFRSRVARFRARRAATQRRDLATTGQRVDSRQRSAAAMLAIVEGNDRSTEGLAGAQTHRVPAQAVPQCPWS